MPRRALLAGLEASRRYFPRRVVFLRPNPPGSGRALFSASVGDRPIPQRISGGAFSAALFEVPVGPRPGSSGYALFGDEFVDGVPPPLRTVKQ